ncbi:hypothetical protein EYZ11_009188 [Aspergillus tanneri]|uniref:Major facilitator superfamily (MFS) profile domain-containing protein n=1 Tax=Aspergillus tanneri TaxID=1220188 RepID=A0A4S3J8Q2_9EURO|nr:uncharacterized protein ATNIH1004_000164 [Aspergillus tanneri]KAA8651283.1 hypothetical protein ATNIH1004_000164 [Aspergillus tanneri]THC91350.1 hypothetical protein EYZ11_009188 [Aspergillus tanneri]
MVDIMENIPLLPPRTRHQTRILILVCTVIVAIEIGDYLSTAPQTQILEEIICRNLHPDASSASICKDTDVQSELALLNGWKDTFSQVPAIILALPFGVMADRVGRKKVALLSILGLMMQEVAMRVICWYSNIIPLQAIWFTPLFQICGGGSQIASSMVFTIVTDIYPVEKRATKFFFIAAAILLAEILATPLSALLMVQSPWVPYLLGLLCEFVGVVAALVVPETLPKISDEVFDDDIPTPRRGSESLFRALLHRAGAEILRLREFITTTNNILAISVAFFAADVGKQALQLMLQYVSKRFEWSMAKASILISLKGIINLVLLLIILPILSHLLDRRLSPLKRDLLIAQFSAAILVLGFIIMAIAPHPVLFGTGVCVFALGWGFYSALRSVASALVSEAQAGLLNTTIALVQGVGGVVAGPALAGMFNYGMSLGGGWIGLPYLLGAGLFLGAGLVTVTVKIHR